MVRPAAPVAAATTSRNPEGDKGPDPGRRHAEQPQTARNHPDGRARPGRTGGPGRRDGDENPTTTTSSPAADTTVQGASAAASSTGTESAPRVAATAYARTPTERAATVAASASKQHQRRPPPAPACGTCPSTAGRTRCPHRTVRGEQGVTGPAGGAQADDEQTNHSQQWVAASPAGGDDGRQHRHGGVEDGLPDTTIGRDRHREGRARAVEAYPARSGQLGRTTHRPIGSSTTAASAAGLPPGRRSGGEHGDGGERRHHVQATASDRPATVRCAALPRRPAAPRPPRRSSPPPRPPPHPPGRPAPPVGRARTARHRHRPPARPATRSPGGRPPPAATPPPTSRVNGDHHRPGAHHLQRSVARAPPSPPPPAGPTGVAAAPSQDRQEHRDGQLPAHGYAVRRAHLPRRQRALTAATPPRPPSAR